MGRHDGPDDAWLEYQCASWRAQRSQAAAMQTAGAVEQQALIRLAGALGWPVKRTAAALGVSEQRIRKIRGDL